MNYNKRTWAEHEDIFVRDMQRIEDGIAKLQEIQDYEVLGNKVNLSAINKFMGGEFSPNLNSYSDDTESYFNSSIKDFIDIAKSDLAISSVSFIEAARDFQEGEKIDIKQLRCSITLSTNGQSDNSTSFEHTCYVSKIFPSTAQLSDPTSTSEQMPVEVFLKNPFTGRNTKVNNKLNVTVRHRPPARISITKLPNRTHYSEGVDIDLTGIEVTAYDEQGNLYDTTDTPLGIVKEELLTFSPSVASMTNRTIEVHFFGQSANFNIEKARFSGIMIKTLPNKRVYNTGDAISLDGIEVYLADEEGNIYYSVDKPDGKIPIDQLRCSPEYASISSEASRNNEVTDIQKIKVIYADGIWYQDFYNITVDLIMPTSMVMTAYQSFYSEESISKSDFYFRLYYNDGTEEKPWIYSSVNYPNGRVPYEEITLSTDVAVPSEVDRTQDVLAFWIRPYDRQLFTATLAVNIIGVTEPHHIKITDTPKIYNGEVIDKTEVYVYAYKANNELWGDKDHKDGQLKPDDFDLINSQGHIIAALSDNDVTPFKVLSSQLGVKYHALTDIKNIELYNQRPSFNEITDELFETVITNLRNNTLSIEDIPWQEGDYLIRYIELDGEEKGITIFINGIQSIEGSFYSLGFFGGVIENNNLITADKIQYGNNDYSYRWNQNTGNNACTLRTFCNDTFKNALPNKIENLLLRFNHDVQIIELNGDSTTLRINDYLSPPGPKLGITSHFSPNGNGVYLSFWCTSAEEFEDYGLISLCRQIGATWDIRLPSERPDNKQNYLFIGFV